jgi:pimeloyl-ACP methyl ester carboxylesterase
MSLEIRNGITLHIERLGEAGSPIVMLHGLFVGSMASWYFTAAPALAERHRVLLYDLRGHGKSERVRAGYDVATMTADLEAVVDAFAVAEKISLVGHSYGAVVALRFALRHPEKIRRLVLVDAPLPPSRLDELNAFVRKNPSEMTLALPPEIATSFAKQGRQARRLSEALHFLATETSLLDDLRGAKDVADSELQALTCETTCIYGSTSSCLPVGERLAKNIPRAKLVVLDGGHFLPAQNPVALTRAIREAIDA